MPKGQELSENFIREKAKKDVGALEKAAEFPEYSPKWT